MPQYHEQAPVLQAVAREVSRDPEIKALRAGKVPAPVNHGHSMPMGGVPPDAGGHPSNGMGLLGGGIAPGHGHVHTMDNRGRRPQPKPGDKRTSQGLHSGYVSPGLSTQPPTTFRLHCSCRSFQEHRSVPLFRIIESHLARCSVGT